jgi:uncharacterized protein YcfJ
MEMEETKEMKTKILTTVAMLGFMSTSAVAETVQDHYKNIIERVPYTESVCNWVDVPIYGQTGGGASAGDVLGGMIIGGLLGKGATGKDNGAAAGAVIGGMIAADKNQSKQGIIGYKQERQCKEYTRYEEQQAQVYSHSTVTFTSNGKTYTLRFKK